MVKKLSKTLTLLLVSLLTPLLCIQPGIADESHRGELAVPQNLSVTNIQPNSVQINFNSVPFARSYTLRLYSSNGENVIGRPKTNFVSGSILTGLTSNQTYFVTIQAIASERGFKNSEESKKIRFNTSSSIASYNVILDATTNGGSVTPASLTFTVGGAALVLPTPNAPAGYSFSNWFTSSTGGTVVASPYTPTANVTIFAQFTPNNYVLTYKLDGGSWFGGGTSDTVYGSVPFGTDVLNASLGYRPLPDPTRAGFNFGGWNTAQGVGAGLGTQTLGASDLTLWAQWTSTVTFDATTNGGTAVSPSSVIYIAGATGITLPTPASRSGYSFNGWYTAASGGSLAPNPYVPSNPSTTLFAQWSPILPKLTVNLNSLSTFNSGTATYQFAMVDAIGLVRTTFIDTVGTLTPLVSGSFTSPQTFTGIQIDPTKFLSTAGGRSTAGPFNFSLWLSVSNSFTSPYTITINSGNASLVDSFNASWVNSGDVWVYLFTMSSDSVITIS